MSPGARDVDDELEPDESDDDVDGAGGDESADDDAADGADDGDAADDNAVDDADDDADDDGEERDVDDDGDAGTRSPRRAVRRVADEGSYVCGSCGEEIVVPLDRTGGEQQEYVEDCPVCCVPNEIHVDFEDDGSARVWARPE